MPGPLAVLEALPLAAAALAHRGSTVAQPLWTPLPGPQVAALDSPADELFYGGSAGGGKSDLLLGYGLTRARHGIVFRRQFRQLLGPEGLIERAKAVVGRPELFNHTQLVWRLPGGRMLEFGAVDHEDDKAKYQGRAHDFKGFDEVPQFSESQYLFLTGWARTTQPGQRVRVIACGNPPQSAEGEWVIQRWAPWLDPQHPRPAEPGELRWYATLDGADRECEDGEPFDWQGERVTPRSRTFIPARLADNPHLEATGYRATLQGLPEPLRSQLLYGDFGIGLQDDPWQVLPMAWVRRAQDWWHEDGRQGLLTAVGVDVAQGGADRTVLARRYGTWYDRLEVLPGAETPDANANAMLVLKAVASGGYAVIDANGIGASTFFLAQAHASERVRSFTGSDRSEGRDKSGALSFVNLRAAAYWAFREALDPANGLDMALPPDRDLRVELCAARWQMQAGGVRIEPKEDIIKRLGRSPDLADAVVMAWWNDPAAERMAAFMSVAGRRAGSR